MNRFIVIVRGHFGKEPIADKPYYDVVVRISGSILEIRFYGDSLYLENGGYSIRWSKDE